MGTIALPFVSYCIKFGELFIASLPATPFTPKGPKIEKCQDLKFSREIVNFKRAAHQTLFFGGGGGIMKVRIEIFKRD